MKAIPVGAHPNLLAHLVVVLNDPATQPIAPQPLAFFPCCMFAYLVRILALLSAHLHGTRDQWNRLEEHASVSSGGRV